jgi:penicillin-binding protein-related factor A (putative recombinase)
MEDWVLFVFSRSNKHYLINAGSEEEAWKTLQKKFTWEIDLVKKECKLVHIMNSLSNNVIVL